MANKKITESLTVTINDKYIPFDFAKLLSNEEIIKVFNDYEIQITELESTEVRKFLQQWLEVLYLQFKRKNSLANEPKESDIVLQGEFRRAS
jgi:hypothetical protein